MLFERERPTSLSPSNRRENGPMSMRSPGFKVVGRSIRRPLRYVPLALPRSASTTPSPAIVRLACRRETCG